MRILQKNKTTHTKALLCVVLLCAVFAFFFFAPRTESYKQVVRGLWSDHQHPQLVSYLNRSDADLSVELGNYYFGGGEYDLARAAQQYERAVSFDPNVSLARYQLARVYFVQGKFTRALEEINDEAHLHPMDFRALYVRALIQISRHDLPAAEADFTQFIKWAPGEWGGYNDLAFVLAREGKYKESEAIIKKAFEKVPGAKQNPWLLNSLGLAQLNVGAYGEASKTFQEALTQAELVTREEWRRAYTANDPGSIDASIETFRDAIRTNLAVAQKNRH